MPNTLKSPSSRISRMKRNVLVGLSIVVWAAALFTLRSEPSSSPSARSSSGVGGFGGLGLNTGADWDPNRDPLLDGRETTLARAVSDASYPVFLPDVPAARASSVTHVWLGSTGTADGLLPTTPRAVIAVAYSSGVQVTILPNQYTPDSDPFSQTTAAASDRKLSAELNGLVSFDSVSGVPVRVIPANQVGQGNPGFIQFSLGTTNADAFIVDVYGRYPITSLETVAASIISQWQAAHA